MFVKSFQPFAFLYFSTDSAGTRMTVISSGNPYHTFSNTCGGVIPSTITSLIPVLLKAEKLICVTFAGMVNWVTFLLPPSNPCPNTFRYFEASQFRTSFKTIGVDHSFGVIIESTPVGGHCRQFRAVVKSPACYVCNTVG